ncbi:cytochrome c family protein [Brevundimonas sp.]|uniref:c-type cytochrome n=1 Tax=Brevundimonas sp. TaxID=1871086 RepID=UPI00286C032B|nr:cytochrome c family protein [Brevundimonas sp.]
MTMLKVLILIGASLLAACSGEPAKAPAKAETPVVQVADVTQLTGDAEAGRTGFGQCRSCHTVEAGVNRVGPSLHAIVGRPVGTVADYRYSTAMAAAGGVWDEQRLYDFLEKPREYIVGTKMTFPGIKDGQRRADIIAYMKTQTD